jgi:hypothetical protein
LIGLCIAFCCRANKQHAKNGVDLLFHSESF